LQSAKFEVELKLSFERKNMEKLSKDKYKCRLFILGLEVENAKGYSIFNYLKRKKSKIFEKGKVSMGK